MISGYFSNSANVTDKTYAGIGDNGTATATAGNITVRAQDTTTLNSVAGAAGGSGTASIGISLNLAILNGTAEARIGGTVKAENGSVEVYAKKDVYKRQR